MPRLDAHAPGGKGKSGQNLRQGGEQVSFRYALCCCLPQQTGGDFYRIEQAQSERKADTYD
jgi:hypothetical protein